MGMKLYNKIPGNVEHFSKNRSKLYTKNLLTDCKGKLQCNFITNVIFKMLMCKNGFIDMKKHCVQAARLRLLSLGSILPCIYWRNL